MDLRNYGIFDLMTIVFGEADPPKEGMSLRLIDAPGCVLISTS